MKNTENLKIENVKTEILIPFSRNSRTHSHAQVQQIASSIKEFGFTNPILIDETNGVIAGHGRLLAAQLLQMLEVPCIRLSYLSEIQKTAYVIADNKIALNANWDLELLDLELSELKIEHFDISLIGFTDNEIQEINNSMTVSPVDEFKEYDEDITTQYECPKCKFEWSGKPK